MTTWLSDALQTHKLQLAATAVVSGALVAGAILGLQTAKREYKVYDLKETIPELNEPHDVEKVWRLVLLLCNDSGPLICPDQLIRGRSIKPFEADEG